jgi:hypothetical protein
MQCQQLVSEPEDPRLWWRLGSLHARWRPAAQGGWLRRDAASSRLRCEAARRSGVVTGAVMASSSGCAWSALKIGESRLGGEC